MNAPDIAKNAMLYQSVNLTVYFFFCAYDIDFCFRLQLIGIDLPSENWYMIHYDWPLCESELITKTAAYEHLKSDTRISDALVKKGAKRVSAQLKVAICC